ncbi:MAG: PQQ-binding-like beta-propeller repeat protein [Pirellulaceae bacterium]
METRIRCTVHRQLHGRTARGVTIDEGRAYAVGAMGNFHCLDASHGEVLWQRDSVADFDVELPIWGIAASPLIYHDKVIEQVSGPTVRASSPSTS